MAFVDRLGGAVEFQQSRDTEGNLIVKVRQLAHA
jgi:hypothetical protein